ncbi:exonuclease domain-containing protein [Maricaulis virginensis]|uniref:Exodeoxyribonuclease I n=1 Tax=Maricaulis virginensis TaxID=144022 RepID=A0A9W6MPZ7_9PROT|nr:exonuclease domain-containing protein [Maricaulis virginensis]GLK53426.1 exodeoxyribonuclease I [Maricaulis virginensis]
MAFIFYDTETTGIDRHFDQILQFAAIRTDEEFNEIDRIERRCRLRPFAIPAPGALAVTGVSIEQCLNATHPTYYEMVSELQSALSEWSPSVFAGWNTIRFDEELFRQALYQNLYPPFLTNTNGNARADILTLAQAVALDLPDALIVPRNPRGRPSFKLDQLAPANGFAHENAHDAIADVEATIFIARLLRERAPEHWSNLMRFANKRSTIAFLQTEPFVVATEAYFGKLSQYALAPIGSNPDIDSEFYCLDITNDPVSLGSLSDAALRALLLRSPKPVRRIKANQSPSLKSWEEIDSFSGLDVDELLDRAEALQRDEDLKNRLLQTALELASVEYEQIHIEQQIYGGFPSKADQQLMDRFHRAPWTEREAVVAQFGDPRLRELGRRLLGEHAHDICSTEVRDYFQTLLHARLTGSGSDVPWRTIAKAREELEEASQTHPQASAILEGFERYLDGLEERVASGC